MDFSIEKSMFFFVSVSHYRQLFQDDFNRGSITNAKASLRDSVILNLRPNHEIVNKRFRFLSNPTKSDNLIEEIHEHINEDLEFIFFYFCGHGQKTEDNQSLALPMSDSSRLLHSNDLFDALAKASNAKIFVVLDCCYSGAITLPNHKNFFVLASSQSDQRSYKGKNFPILTELLIQLFGGGIDKTELTIRDIVNFVKGKNPLYKDEYRIQEATTRTSGMDIGELTFLKSNVSNEDLGYKKVAYSSEVSSSEYRNWLDKFAEIQDKDTTYIFIFGQQGAGKTAITSSLIYHMGTQPEGTLSPVNHSFKKADFQNYVKTQFGRGKFLDRNRKDEILEVDFIYTDAKSEEKMKITFLEMSGENFNVIESGRGAVYTEGVEKYLRCDNIKMIFFLVVDHVKAREEDLFILNFLEYLESIPKKNNQQETLLLISKWDTYPNNLHHKSDIDKFVKERMPFTFKKLDSIGGAIVSYSVGTIHNDEVIQIDEEKPKIVKNWLFEQIVGFSPLENHFNVRKIWEYLQMLFGLKT